MKKCAGNDKAGKCHRFVHLGKDAVQCLSGQLLMRDTIKSNGVRMWSRRVHEIFSWMGNGDYRRIRAGDTDDQSTRL